ncbi:nose resistant to fluoxetine protein 6-like [Ischnura elegans]|uniref:nose resistant to fluoxetine protein 6-like n=1 Tax=Ischnura elegans TaxID=197161 RepID=UPI001ED8BDBA|nr:nose resistant to fluoxetine protein 6-like [Ischnura elegans]
MNRLVTLLLWFIHAVFVSAENRGTSLPFPFVTLPPFAPSYDSVKNLECKNHALTYLKELHELKLWAVQMYDASGKIASGVMAGNVNWLGNDRQCLGVTSRPEAAKDDPENIRGQYCSFRIFADPRDKDSSSSGDLKEIYDHIHANDMTKNDIDDGIIFFPSVTPLSMGVCVPHSCTLKDVEGALAEWLAPLNSTVKLRLLTTETSCSLGDRDLTRPYGVMLFSLAMTLVGIMGAVYEKRKEKKGEDPKRGGVLVRTFLAFSFRTNMRTLLDTSTPKDELSCLNGLRTILSLILFFLHRGLLILAGSVANRNEVATWMQGPKSMILRSFWIYVDTFVVMSGLLTSYYTVKRLQEGKKLNILKMYIRRYIKMTPLFVMSALTGLSAMQLFPSEGHYSRLLYHYISCCEEAWLNVLTYTNTPRGLQKMCYQLSHQLETDMHMYILSPFIVLLLWKMGKYSILPLSLVIAALSALKVYKLYTLGLATVLYFGISLTKMIASADELYLNFIHRLIPYIFGVSLGYILRVREKNSKLRPGRFFLGGIFAVCGAYYSFLYMSNVSYPGYVFDPMEHALFGVFQPLLWCFSISWFIFTCASGQAEFFDRMLSWKGFIISSRLSFAFYMIQMPIMLINGTLSTDPVYVSIVSLFDLNVFVITTLASIWLTLVYLIPIGNIWNIFAEPKKQPIEDLKKE